MALVKAPAGFERVLGELPPEAAVTSSLRGRRPFDLLILFAPSRAVLERELPRLRERLDEAGGLWIAWPKKSAGVPTDLSDGVVRSAGLALGLVDNKVCAIDGTWSGLRFVVRRADRARRRRTPVALPARA